MLISKPEYRMSMMRVLRKEAEPWLKKSAQTGIAAIPEYSELDDALVDQGARKKPQHVVEAWWTRSTRSKGTSPDVVTSKNWLETHVSEEFLDKWRDEHALIQPKWVLTTSAALLKEDRMLMDAVERKPDLQQIPYHKMVAQLYQRDNLAELAKKTRLPMDVVDVVARYYALEYGRLKNPKESVDIMLDRLEFCYPSRAGIKQLCRICDEVLYGRGQMLEDVLKHEKRRSQWEQVKRVGGQIMVGSLIAGTSYMAVRENTKPREEKPDRHRWERPVLRQSDTAPILNVPVQNLLNEQPQADSAEQVQRRLNHSLHQQQRDWQKRVSAVPVDVHQARTP